MSTQDKMELLIEKKSNKCDIKYDQKYSSIIVQKGLIWFITLTGGATILYFVNLYLKSHVK